MSFTVLTIDQLGAGGTPLFGDLLATQRDASTLKVTFPFSLTVAVNNVSISNIETLTSGTGVDLTLSSVGDNDILLMPAGTGSVKIGTTGQFQVNASGNLTKINDITTNWPALQGAADSVLQNDGAGNLSWAALSFGDVTGPGSALAHGLVSFADSSGTLLESISTLSVGANNTLTGGSASDVIIASANNHNIQLNPNGVGVTTTSVLQIASSGNITGLLNSDTTNFTLKANSGNGNLILAAAGNGGINLNSTNVLAINGCPIDFNQGGATYHVGIDTSDNNFFKIAGGGDFTNVLLYLDGNVGDTYIVNNLHCLLNLSFDGAIALISTPDAGTATDLTITTGNSTSNGATGADFSLFAGAGGPGGAGGQVALSSGDGGAGAGGNGADFSIQAGNAGTGSNGTGGNLSLGAGAGNGAGAWGVIQLTSPTEGTGTITSTGQPAFSAYLASSATNATGNNASYPLGALALTKLYDNTNSLNTNGTFTAPKTGKYRFNAKVQFTNLNSNVATTFTAALVTTARSYPQTTVRPAGTGDCSIPINECVPMTAGDTAVINVAISGYPGNTVTIVGSANGNTTFSGFQIVG